MLSFDYSPLLRNSINSLTFNPLSAAPSACSALQCQPSRRMIRQTRPQFRRPVHNRVVPRSAFLNLVSTSQIPEVYSRVIDNPNSYVIQVKKNNSDNYHGYSVLYKLINDKISVQIQSEADDFHKIYQFDKSLVDIDDVSWQIASGILSITIPKRIGAGQFVLRPSVRVRARSTSPYILQDNKKIESDSDCFKPDTESKDEQDQEMSDSHDRFQEPEHITAEQESGEQSSSSEGESTRKARIISIPIKFQDSSNDLEVLRPTIRKALNEKEDCKSRTESEAGLESVEAPSPKLPKLTKRVSLEEIEDEALL